MARIITLLLSLVVYGDRSDPDKLYKDRYKMNHPDRGICVIVNNHKFEPSTGMGLRGGTYKDEERMVRHFKGLGFDVESHNDMSKAEFMRLLMRVSSRDHENNDAFVMVILSHGESGGKIWMTDATVLTKDILSYFKGHNCPGLVGKPKIFILQACRGGKLDKGVHHFTKRSADRWIPYEADFLVAYGTTPGYISWRNTDSGSWFIQKLSAVLYEYAHKMDLLTMLTRVSYRVAYEKRSRNNQKPHKDKLKQQIQIMTSLTKEVYLQWFGTQV